MARFVATTNPQITPREIRNTAAMRRIAPEGMVLLRNDGVLPLKEDDRNVILLGNGARHTVKGGTGSGEISCRYTVNIEEGLEQAGFQLHGKSWRDRYDAAYQAYEDERGRKARQARDEFGWKAGVESLRDSDPLPYPEVLASDWEGTNDKTAVFVISRNSGEGKDRQNVRGDYQLLEEEEKALTLLSQRCERLVVVLNVGAPVDTAFLRALPGKVGILLMSQPGAIGGQALADVLVGRANPNGRLTATWALAYSDYPCWDTFASANGDLDDEYYRDDIYVGYRYFDTFGKEVAYPFGFGLSYTAFDISASAALEGNEVVIRADVTNTGDAYSSRETVQVYFSAPGQSMEKPYQELAAYGKTKPLAPGESQSLTLRYPLSQMASYDVKRASYVLEKGMYDLRVGNHSRNTHIIARIEISREVVTQVLSNRLNCNEFFDVLTSRGAQPIAYPAEEAERSAAPVLTADVDAIPVATAIYRKRPEELPKAVTAKPITWTDLQLGKHSMEELVSQLTVEELANLCVGQVKNAATKASFIGTASISIPGAGGETTAFLRESRFVPPLVVADGPAGLRLSKMFAEDEEGNLIQQSIENAVVSFAPLYADQPKLELPANSVWHYQYCTSLPIATLLAQTWDEELLYETGDIVGEELAIFGVGTWLAPGMNIHRNPLCGRNFEYYSEDPLVSGLCASAQTLGLQKHEGKSVCIKHFAMNNQEDNRGFVNVHVSERAAREIYLRGFEIAVRKANPLCIMTAYNLINGVHAANSWDLLTAIARDEWGFEHFFMTDWHTTCNMNPNRGEKKFYDNASVAGCIAAGNDLLMPGEPEEIEALIRCAHEPASDPQFAITKADLQSCAVRVLRAIQKAKVSL